MTPLETLTEINLADLVAAFGWQDRPMLSGALRKLFLRPARRFARQMVEFDAAIGAHGLVEASRLALRNHVKDIRVFGSDRIPDGPVLALSNHPGLSDTLALFCALNRLDLMIIALDRPFLKALPNTSRHLYYLEADSGSRISLVRQVASHLRAGRSVLTFPAGQIEPDPDIYAGALESLQAWTDSAGSFARLAPDCAILPVLVRGVIWKRAANHPLLGIKKTGDEREKLAAALQLLNTMLWNTKPVTVTVQVGKPIIAREIGTTDTRVLHNALIHEMRSLIECPPVGEGINML